MDLSIKLTTAVVSCGLGAVVRGSVFNKLSHIVEYVLIKKFGDYTNPMKTFEGEESKVIIAMPNDHYYTQNIARSLLVSLISYKAIQILASAGCSRNITLPLLVGSIAASILFALVNMELRRSGHHKGCFVRISDTALDKIKKENIPFMSFSEKIYCDFGFAPEICHGEHTDPAPHGGCD